ncbi:nitrite reductase small subunit NirD [Mangrovicoccus ximenensis]|uniref:nitrite reductase small subunit NirD n=1 Tax=Mangrovicoccus ximenensis TaxID=1911570 RepID=UPI000D39E1AC|nr:nitrite reductase small subunit NirD [Mangrovicoccus ximenensis]
MKTWIEIGSLDDIPVRGARVVKTSRGCIAVFRTAEDEVHALDDACPHKGGPLSEGIVHGGAVTCPLHNRVFDFATGAAKGADSEVVATHSVKIVDGRLMLDITGLAARNVA